MNLPIASITFSTSTLSLLVMVAIGLSALAVVFSILSGGRRSGSADSPIHLEEALRSALHGHGSQLKRLEEAVRALSRTDKKQDVLIRGSIRNVALLRYDAFEDVGGRLSFSCALLDAVGTGLVLTSINGRQETRVYAKPVAEGRSTHNLSREEEAAIRQAMSESEEAVVR